MKERCKIIPRPKIYKVLKESPYIYQNGDLILYFSSIKYQSSFINKIELFRKIYLFRMTQQANRKEIDIDVEIGIIPDVLLYSNVEGRGFHIQYKGEIYTCLKSLKLVGDLVKKKS